MRLISYMAKETDDGRPVKRVVRSELHLSHRQFTSLKARGAILIDGVSVHADHIVRAGQVLQIRLEEEAPISSVVPFAGEVSIVCEDDDIMIIDKAAPLATMYGLEGGDSLEARLAALRGPGFVFRPVNRLDRGTSGLMAAAKHAHAQQIMQKALHTDDYVREYIAVAEGAVEPRTGIIDAPIGKADGATVRREVREDGKQAVTEYCTVAAGNGMTMLRLRLRTGRTHQIRVHLKHIGHPVAGDFLYGHEDARLPGRFALHSCALSLIHPLTGERLRFESPAPAAFIELLSDR